MLTALLLAALAPLPAVYALPWEPVEFKLKGPRTDVSLESFAVKSPFAPVAKVINAQVAQILAPDASVTRWRTQRGDQVDVGGGCEPEVLTNRLVSFRCGQAEVPVEPEAQVAAGEFGGPYRWEAYNYRVDGVALTRITPAMLFAPGVDAQALLSKLAGKTMTPSGQEQLVIVPEGLGQWVAGEVGDDQDPLLTIRLEDLRPHLAPDHPWKRLEGMAPIDGKARRFDLGAGVQRFEGTDVITDHLTGLRWTAADNGADITHPAAMAYCEGLDLGGAKDWRAPTAFELDLLSDVVDNHKPADRARDCSRGKYYYALGAPFRLSCRLVWSATLAGGSAHVMNFVASATRTSPLTRSKHHRALCVRGTSSVTITGGE